MNRYGSEAPLERRPETGFQGAPGPLWPSRVIQLGARWARGPNAADRDEILAELWPLLNGALARYVRVHALRLGPVDVEEQRDIAADKSLELVRRLDQRVWNPAATTPRRLCGYLSALARNGIVDHIRRVSRVRFIGLAPTGLADRSSGDGRETALAVDGARFVTALRACVLKLAPRAQKAWFLRIFVEMPSKTIARHPDVGMTPAAVDMTLARCRQSIRRCMRRRGFESTHIPAGAFTSLWEQFSHAADENERGA